MGKQKNTEQTIQQKKDHAKILYVHQGVTVGKELADRVGVSPQTISKWINANDKEWERLRQSTLVTKDAELRRLYMQLTELNDVIEARPKGERYANSREADTLSKITKSIREMETDTNIGEVMAVMKDFLVFSRQQDTPVLEELIKISDHFVKSKLK